jgi:hypothetical protein
MKAQRLALRTAKDILDRIILELVASEAPMRLVTPVDHRDVRLNLPLQQPSEKLAAADLTGDFCTR